MKNKKDFFYKIYLHNNWGKLYFRYDEFQDNIYILNTNIDLLRNNGHKLINVKQWADSADDAFDISLF